MSRQVAKVTFLWLVVAFTPSAHDGYIFLNFQVQALTDALH